MEYKIKVATMDGEDYAFDGDIYLKMYGAEGQSSDIKLLTADGGRPTFSSASVLELPVKGTDVGVFNYITVKMDANGTKTQWGLDRVEVTNTATGAVAVFKYGSCLSSWNDLAYLYPQSSYTYKVGLG